MIKAKNEHRMKIVYLYSALDTVGGADRVITEKANYFAEVCDYEVYIVTAHQNNVPVYFPLSPKMTHIDLAVDFTEQYRHPLLKRAYLYFKLLREYKKKLTKLLFELRPDLTITTISRDIDFLCSIKDGSLKVAEAHIAKPYIRNLHLMVQQKGIYEIIGRIWRHKLEKAIAKFDALVVLTDRDAQSWESFQKAYVIPNSLPFYPQASSSCESKKIISVGRLSEQKGYDMLVKSWEGVHTKHPEWTLTIYGEGALHDELTREIEAKGLKETLILAKPVTQIMERYLESSIYVMSSRFEGFGMVLAEAMACGVPCVSFDCPHGPSDIIVHGEDGLLARNEDTADLTEQINYLIEQDEIRKQMGAKAKENIARYSREIIMNQWVQLFDHILKEKRK